MDLPPRYEAVLRHVGRYRLLLPEALGWLMQGESARSQPPALGLVRDQGARTLARLRDQGYLNHHHHKSADYPPFPGNVPYYTLTPQGAKTIGMPLDRAEELGGHVFSNDALTVHLAALWFAVLGSCRCWRAEPAELAKLLGKHKFFDNVPHCLRHDPDGWRIYRLYVASTDIPGVVEQVRRQAIAVSDLPGVADWLPYDYAIAVLAGDKRLCVDLKKALERASLGKLLYFRVCWTPTPETLREAMRELETVARERA